MTAKAKKTKRQPFKLTEADSIAVMAWCVGVTASMVKGMQGAHGDVDPKEFESLKLLQLEFDRRYRAAIKSGAASTIGQYLPPPPVDL